MSAYQFTSKTQASSFAKETDSASAAAAPIDHSVVGPLGDVSAFAENLESMTDDVARIQVAMEALRSVPVNELNSAVVAMFETHLPRGGVRVSTERAMTPVGMRRMALESGDGVIATVGKAISNAIKWLMERLKAFINWITGKEKKSQETAKETEKVEKKIEISIKLTHPTGMKEIPKESLKDKRSGDIVMHGGKLGIVLEGDPSMRVLTTGISEKEFNTALDLVEENVKKAEGCLNDFLDMTKTGKIPKTIEEFKDHQQGHFALLGKWFGEELTPKLFPEQYFLLKTLPSDGSEPIVKKNVKFTGDMTDSFDNFFMPIGAVSKLMMRSSHVLARQKKVSEKFFDLTSSIDKHIYAGHHFLGDTPQTVASFPAFIRMYETMMKYAFMHAGKIDQAINSMCVQTRKANGKA